MDSLVGKSMGRYQLTEQLGEGGMATVYKAFDTSLDRYVAIKVIVSSQQSSSNFLKRFEREARALARLSYPNIVNVHDYGEEDGIPYLVMEYLPGGTLKEMMGQPMHYADAARLLAPIARALEYAHSQNIIHRDVKPANILMTASGQPMLSDFGIAKMLSEEQNTALTGVGVGIGTPEYMAPEQGRGLEVDHRADIYALGVMLYELITGRKPYRADTPMAVIIKHIQEPIPQARAYVPNLPEMVERILSHAMSKEPENRYQSMKEFAADLENLIYRAASPMTEQASAPTNLPPTAQLNAPPAQPAKREAVVAPTAVQPIPPQADLPAKKRSLTWVWFVLGGLALAGLVMGGICLLGSGALLAFMPTSTPEYSLDDSNQLDTSASTEAFYDSTELPETTNETAEAPTVEARTLTGTTISDMSRGIDSFESYRVNLSFSSGEENVSFLKEFIQSSGDFHSIFTMTNLDGVSGSESVDLYFINNETWGWLAAQNACAYMGGSDVAAETDTLSLQMLFNEIVLGELVAQDEIINSISTDHYKVQTLTTFEGITVAIPNSDVWIDQELGYIVRFTGNSEDMPSMEETPGELVSWEYNLYDTNLVFGLSLPTACVK